jgi:hypothetical protein
MAADREDNRVADLKVRERNKYLTGKVFKTNPQKVH